MANFVWLERQYGKPRTARAGRVRLSLDLLAQMLFPDGTTIVRARETESSVLGVGELELVVQGPELPVIWEGETIPLMHPTYRTHCVPDGSVMLRTVEFDSWQVPG